uniref:FHA domain-containing protein n=1 Tax=Globodera pallida TaxID=36090 RepID=A0A183C259_GLOPA
MQDEGIFAEPNLPSTSLLFKTKSEEKDESEMDQNQQQQQQQTILSDFRYQEPTWALIPTGSEQEYFLEIIKEGTVIDSVRLHNDAHQKSFWSIGRFEPCDIKLEHPSVSRFHAILQYGECVRGRPGWYLFDLNSTHGVRLNKQSIKKRAYVPLHNGFVFQIAGSSRLFTVCGGPSRVQKEEGTAEKAPEGKAENIAKAEGEEEELEEGHRFYEKDPMGWLQKYFEREGASMHFQFTKSAPDGGGGGAGNLLAEFEDEQNKKKGRRHSEDGGHWTCSIELVSDVSLTCGSVVTVLAPSKRLAQLQCALVACERLDNACLLRISSLWCLGTQYTENDFYDSDEDIFLDRTGQIEEQREKRRRRFGADTFGSSVGRAKNYAELVKELAETESKLEIIGTEMQRLLQKDKIRVEQLQQEDEQQPKQPNFTTRMALSQMKGKEKKLLKEKDTLQKLVEIAKPSFRLAPFVQKKPLQQSESAEDVVKTEASDTEGLRETMMGEEKCEKEVDSKEGAEIKIKQETVAYEEGERGSEKVETDQEVRAVTGTSAESRDEESESGASRNAKEEDKFSRNDSSASSLPSETEVKSDAGGAAALPPEERCYAPALPPQHNEVAANAFVPKFGMLTKEEMVRMKFLQRQMEKKPELAAAAKRARLQQQELLKADEEEGELKEMGLQQVHDVREKYATWLPPEDQSGDGSTRLNQKFAGKY